MGLFLTRTLRLRHGPDVAIVALNWLDARLAVAKRMGATHAINTSDRSSAEALRAATSRPDADVAIEAIGTVERHREALSLLGRGGTLVAFGGVAPGQLLPVDVGRLHYQETAILSHLPPHAARRGGGGAPACLRSGPGGGPGDGAAAAHRSHQGPANGRRAHDPPHASLPRAVSTDRDRGGPANPLAMRHGDACIRPGVVSASPSSCGVDFP